MNPTIEVMLSEAQIHIRIRELAAQINQRYQDSTHELVLIGLLRGSFIFMADLCRLITVPHSLDFMTVSSYGNETVSSRNIKIIKDLDDEIHQKHVLIIEDIIDSGNTLSKVYQLLTDRAPASIEICTFLDKPSRREVTVAVDYIGFSIPDEFVIGYGLDYAQRYRHLPFVGRIVGGL
ncbi:MAG: hypoxanthine phosphoribosyltransferase [Pseudomonadota bacterium]|nr:hypoxanthine phosphoribosyltransferase [Pseudomonadota bacterium]